MDYLIAELSAPANIINNYCEREEYGIEINGVLTPNATNFRYNNCFKRKKERDERERIYGTVVPLISSSDYYEREIGVEFLGVSNTPYVIINEINGVGIFGKIFN